MGKMKFYDETGGSVIIKKKEHIGKNVYSLNEKECIKTEIDTSLVSLSTLKCIQDLNLPGMYQIKQYLFNQKSIFKAYIMKYYPKESINFFLTSIDYTLENYIRFRKIAEELTKKGVLITDLHTGNVIINYDGMTIIDTDLYIISEYVSPTKIAINNLHALRYIFRELYLENWIAYYGSSNIPNIKELFDINPDETVKRLKKYKRPLDIV